VVFKIVLQFFLGIAQHGSVLGMKGEVLEVVEAREYTYFGKLTHAGDEDELQQVVGFFEHGVEPAQEVAVFDGLR
jgi:hypothetical protein